MRKICLSLALMMIPSPCYSVTIMKNVGHSDCYVVISDGRIIVIDVGPKSSGEGLVALLKSEYFHYDRIVITHVHSDHAGGLITAGQYARQKGSKLSADMLVSNHGEHDVDVVIRESNVRTLLTSFRSQSVVGMDDQALAKLAFADENIAIEGIALSKPKGTRSENASGLVLKVTEIRDGQRRATLFLGDIGKSQQSRLFSHPEVKEIFRNVRAVTLPHHGRSTTLHHRFFDNIKAFAEPGVILLHSDRAPLNRRVAAKAAQLELTMKSTAGETKGDILVNLFGDEKTFHVVRPGMTDLAKIVMREKGSLIGEGNLRLDEIVDAVSRFCNRSTSNPLPTNTVISWPTDNWIRQEVEKFNRETERMIARLESLTVEESTAAEKTLAGRRSKLSQTQMERIDRLVQEVAARRRIETEILRGLQSGWRVERNPNINTSRFFLYGSKAEQEASTGLRNIVEESRDGIWEVHEVGPIDSVGIPTSGKTLVRMRRPVNVTAVDRKVCEYCGRTAYGYCTIRHKYVCESHRYFTQGGTHWVCP